MPETPDPFPTDKPVEALDDLAFHGDSARLAGALEELHPASLDTPGELDAAAGLCEAAGIPERGDAFRDEKRRRGEATAADYRRQAEMAASRGALDEALELLDAALAADPDSPAAVREKFFLLRRLGRVQDALALLGDHEAVLDPGERRRLEETVRGEEAPPAAAGATPERRWSVAHLHRFLELFGGRAGVHARQWASPSGGFGYNPVYSSLTPRLVEEHLEGRQTLGVYQLDEESRVRWLAFDVDIRSDRLPAALKQRPLWQGLLGAAFRTAAAIADLCAMEGLKTFLEYSGFKGYHVWVPLASPVPAADARLVGQFIQGHAGEVSPDISVEVFPKQARLQGKNMGNLVKLPLGVHLRTGRRSAFVGPQGAELPDPWEHLFAVAPNPVATLAACLERIGATRIAAAAEPPALRGEPPVRPAPSAGAGAGAEGLPWEDEAPPYDPAADARLNRILSRCALMASVVEKARSTGELSYDEQLCVVHVLGHLDTGVQAVNHILHLLSAPSPDLFLKSRLRGNPASCAKLRARLLPGAGEETVCACDFGENPETYPNPVLHLSGWAPPAGAPAEPLREHTLQVQGLIRRYLDLRERLRLVQNDFTAVEKSLLALFAEQGVDALPTPMGTLRAVAREGAPPRLVLEF